MNRKHEQAYRGKITSPLDKLFGDSTDEAKSNSVALELLHLPVQQPRRYFDPHKMEQLVQSVKEHGILEPLLVRPIEDGRYELVAGERRYRAAIAASLSEVPVTVRELSDEDALHLSLVENLQREDLNPVEETEGILQLIALKLEITLPQARALLYRMANEAKGNVNRNVTVNSEHNVVEEVFVGLGLMKWQSFVRNRLPLLNLPEEILIAMSQGRIAYTKAELLARIRDEQERKTLLESAIRDDLSLEKIRDRISGLRNVKENQSPKGVFKTISSRLNKSKNLWDNPKKVKKLTALLQQMEALIDD